ncbi:hypothetical protein FRC07_007169, partial [Ceratobasidium sp. 392]
NWTSGSRRITSPNSLSRSQALSLRVNISPLLSILLFTPQAATLERSFISRARSSRSPEEAARLPAHLLRFQASTLDRNPGSRSMYTILSPLPTLSPAL